MKSKKIISLTLATILISTSFTSTVSALSINEKNSTSKKTELYANNIQNILNIDNNNAITRGTPGPIIQGHEDVLSRQSKKFHYTNKTEAFIISSAIGYFLNKIPTPIGKILGGAATTAIGNYLVSNSDVYGICTLYKLRGADGSISYATGIEFYSDKNYKHLKDYQYFVRKAH